jgi:hypothetical protein
MSEKSALAENPKSLISFGAGEGIRTLDPNLGKEVFMAYFYTP